MFVKIQNNRKVQNNVNTLNTSIINDIKNKRNLQIRF